PNPVLSTIRYFRDEYEAHIKDRKCPAFVCQDLFTSPCRDTCPVNIDVHGYVALIAEGMFKEALELIKERNPFPAICGRVCHHPCETRCRRAEIDKPLALRILKRFVADHEVEWRTGPPAPIPRTRTERIAIVGSGPAGLACAHALVRKGYGVTVFESLPVPGGILAVGIPPYRLPREVLGVEIEDILALGVEIKTGVTIGKDIELKELFDLGYNAIFIAAGAHKSVPLGVPGENLRGVVQGIKFLREFNLGRKVEVGTNLVVIGGGHLATDVARTALRLGAKKAIIRSREAVKRLVGRDGRVAGVECIKVERGRFDKSGRRRPIPVEGSEHIIEADMVVAAADLAPDLTFLSDDTGIKLSGRGTILVDNNTRQTNVAGVFAGGDVVTGPATVIEAVAAGDRAAESIERFLGKAKRRTARRKPKAEQLSPRLTKIQEKLAKKPRFKMERLHANRGMRGFEEVVLGMTNEQAIQEAKRCLRCHEKD
ncbi:MAG: FAD-dependent oxidoreductase, partial [Actinomycetota bacterium]